MKKELMLLTFFFLCRDSNRRPTRLQVSALPTAASLAIQFYWIILYLKFIAFKFEISMIRIIGASVTTAILMSVIQIKGMQENFDVIFSIILSVRELTGEDIIRQ
jgi:hypothetical protein